MKLSDEERAQLDTLIHTGKHPAWRALRARILLKADASEAGESWSDSRIAAALDTSVDTVARTRQLPVEEGFEAVLIRKHSAASARRRIFVGQTAHLRWSRRGQADRLGLFRTAQRTRTVDPETAGNRGGRADRSRRCAACWRSRRMAGR